MRAACAIEDVAAGQRCNVATDNVATGNVAGGNVATGPEAKDNVATDATHRSPDELKARPCAHATCNKQHATDNR